MSTLELDARDELAIEQELDRRECAADPLTFMGRHVSIEEPNGRAIKLRLWPFQRRAVRALHDDKAVIVLKARRLGLSWIVLAYALWLAMFQQGVRILILCKTGDDAAELLDRIRRMRDRIAADRTAAHLLAGLEAGAKDRDAVTTLDVGASTIKALVGTPSAARSETAGLILLDEFAFQRGAGDIWTAALPTIEGGGRVAVVSTGNGSAQGTGVGSEFAKQWNRAVAGISGFVALFFAWSDRPDRDDDWYGRMQEQLGDPDRMRREYPTEADDAFVSPDAIFVYDPSGVSAAERLGRHYDELRLTGQLPPPAGDAIQLGIDWGLGSTHALIIWPLAGGGIYIPPGEISAQRGEPTTLTRQMLAAAAAYDPPLDEARYDSAGGQQMATFAVVAPETVGIHGVAFAKRKKRTIGFLRELFRRTAEGKDHRIIAISPENPVLLSQLRDLQQNEHGEVIKGNDHGPDALIAGAWPIAAEFPDPTVAPNLEET